MGGIGAVSPLRRFAPALPEGEPRAWWALMVGWRDKGAVGVVVLQYFMVDLLYFLGRLEIFSWLTCYIFLVDLKYFHGKLAIFSW